MLARLARNTRGNVAALMAVMLVPLVLFVGSAVDVSRVYTVKARLQQACDAGALAGRRVMTGTGSTLDTYAVSQATAFFNNNFHLGWMQTAATTIAGQPAGTVFVPAKTSESQVSGSATVSVPMAIMKFFGFQPVTLTATCEARYDTADADIMFVLDVTGSMACYTSDNVSDCNNYAGSTANQTTSNGVTWVTEKTTSGSNQARIVGLRAAVLNFFDTVTDPSNADPSTNFRFGFVPYNATVNVGKTLYGLGYVNTGSVYYQTRVFGGDGASGSPTTSTVSVIKPSCTGTTRNPAAINTYLTDGNGYPYATTTTLSWSSGTCTSSAQKVVPIWNYQRSQWPVTNYVTATSVNNPTVVGAQSVSWAGCVEEPADPSSDNQTTFSTTSPPHDLDPDPSTAFAAGYWTPWWPEVEYYRSTSPVEVSIDQSRSIESRLISGNWYPIAHMTNELACPAAQAKRLSATTLPGGSSASTKANVRQSISDYLSFANGFRAYGTTYHDIGMLWGLRLISPTGLFANDTVAWTGHNAPNRFIIFLTDGDMESDPVGEGGVYSANGMEMFDSRVANGATGSSLNNYHYARFAALCQMAKNRNIKIFTISYAQAKTSQMIACASPGQDYYASDAAGLQTAFTAIAKQVALLRISK